jgi:hypothetical protein
VGLLELAKQLGNVSRAAESWAAAATASIASANSTRRAAKEALKEISRRKPILKNRVPAELEEAVLELATEQPACGQVRVASELKKRGLTISPAGIRTTSRPSDVRRNRKIYSVTLRRIGARSGCVLSLPAED